MFNHIYPQFYINIILFDASNILKIVPMVNKYNLIIYILTMNIHIVYII